MKGFIFTLTVFLIIMSFVLSSGISNVLAVERKSFTNEMISAQRIFYTWKAVSNNLGNILNVSSEKVNDTVTFNDTLPAENDIGNLLGDYQEFIRKYYEDPTIKIRFEDPTGTEVQLNQTESNILIKPMNIEYSWPDYGKNELFIKVDPSNFTFIDQIDMYLRVAPAIKDNINNINWAPYKSCNQNTVYCLRFNLTVTDGSKTWISDKKEFDLDFQSSVKVGLTGEPSSDFFIRATVGQLPVVVNVDMLNANVTSSTKLKLTTEEFYINYLARINVTTDFGQKVG